MIHWLLYWPRERKRHATAVVEIADIEGLTPLQVQVALDAAMATFAQRLYEMRQQ